MSGEYIWLGGFVGICVLASILQAQFQTIREPKTKRKIIDWSIGAGVFASLASLTYISKSLSFMGPGSGIELRGWPLPWLPVELGSPSIVCIPLIVGDIVFWFLITWICLVGSRSILHRVSLSRLQQYFDLGAVVMVVFLAASMPILFSALDL